MSSIKRVIKNLEEDLKIALRHSEWHQKEFKNYEKKIIELKLNINELKQMEKAYHDHSRCL